MKIIRDSLTGIIFGLILTSSYIAYEYLANPRPYTDVVVNSVERTSEDINVVVTFRKTSCVFNRLTAVGIYSGIYTLLPWVDLGGEQGDRDAGYHTLYLDIDTSHDTAGRRIDINFDSIELRTRHICNPGTDDEIAIDKVLMSYDFI